MREIVNLGASGLDLVFRLYRVAEVVDPLPVDEIEAQELGAGDYLLEGLPNQQGQESYVLVVATAGEPEQALAIVKWGGAAGLPVVWSDDVEAVTPGVLKRGDTYGGIALRIKSGLPKEVGDSEASAEFAMADRLGNVSFTGRAAQITGVVYNETHQSYGATLVYQLQEGDTEEVGNFRGEFKLTIPGRGFLTVPSREGMLIEVRADIRSAS